MVAVPTYPLFLFPPYLAHEREERLIDVVAQGGRSFVERAAKLFGQRFALLRRDLALGLQVQLVCHQHQRYVFRQSYPCDQLPILGRFLEAVPIRDGVTDDETLAATHILVAHGSKLHLAGRIQYVEQGGFPIDDGLLLVRVLNRRIVVVQEAMAHELECDGCKKKKKHCIGKDKHALTTG